MSGVGDAGTCLWSVSVEASSFSSGPPAPPLRLRPQHCHHLQQCIRGQPSAEPG